MNILKFHEFISENKVIPAGIEEPEDGSDKKLEAEVEEYVDKNSEVCPRCNEPFDLCKCTKNDYWSTHTFHRAPKGKIEKSKPKQQFKQQ